MKQLPPDNFLVISLVNVGWVWRTGRIWRWIEPPFEVHQLKKQKRSKYLASSLKVESFESRKSPSRELLRPLHLISPSKKRGCRKGFVMQMMPLRKHPPRMLHVSDCPKLSQITPNTKKHYATEASTQTAH